MNHVLCFCFLCYTRDVCWMQLILFVDIFARKPLIWPFLWFVVFCSMRIVLHIFFRGVVAKSFHLLSCTLWCVYYRCGNYSSLYWKNHQRFSLLSLERVYYNFVCFIADLPFWLHHSPFSSSFHPCVSLLLQVSYFYWCSSGPGWLLDLVFHLCQFPCHKTNTGGVGSRMSSPSRYG